MKDNIVRRILYNYSEIRLCNGFHFLKIGRISYCFSSSLKFTVYRFSDSICNTYKFIKSILNMSFFQHINRLVGILQLFYYDYKGLKWSGSIPSTGYHVDTAISVYGCNPEIIKLTRQ